MVDKERLRKLIDFHFKTDCMACQRFNEDSIPCIHTANCECARTYQDVINELDVLPELKYCDKCIQKIAIMLNDEPEIKKKSS